jgi:hypothetical protein
MNVIFISPNFPKTYYHFCQELKNNGVRVLGIAQDGYDSLSYELKKSLDDYYQVSNMEDYDAMYQAVAYFAFKYGKIDFIESNNEYWLELEARLRSDFNVKTGRNLEDIIYFKEKSAMKEKYALAGVKTPRYLLVDNIDNARVFIEKVGYPVIVKPNNGVGAYHTYKLSNDKELVDFFSHLPDVPYIMEEFVQGDLISFDGITSSNCEVLFSSNEVFPFQVMDIVNHNLDCFYYSNKQMPQDLLEQGERVLKAFNAKYRYFHLEFFRLNKDKIGLGKKGELVGLEVNMRCPGGYTPDMINFSKSVNTYKIWADSLAFKSSSYNNTYQKYYCVYYGRKDGKQYAHSHQEILDKYQGKIKMAERLPDILSQAMGNDFYIVNVDTKDEIDEFYRFLSA